MINLAKTCWLKPALAACALLTAACNSDESEEATSEILPTAQTSAPVPPTAGLSVDEASRFLSQATFGATTPDIDELVEMSMSSWLQAEFAKPQESLLEEVLLAETAGENVGAEQLAETFWTRAITSDDRLRQRVGYALSQIIVVSYNDSGVEDRPVAMANYMDIMAAGAFGNFRQLLENVTYSPAMAIYLTYLQNQRADEDREVVPDENYAREVMQLFTIGLLELEGNGELRLDGSGNPIETYDNVDVTELAKVFTGLSWAERDRFFGRPDNLESEYLPLVMFDDQHSAEPKSFLGTTIPGNTLGDRSIEIALDVLFEHPNTPPFISKQLIQRLVTSNPSSAYVGRVADAFRTGSYTLPDGAVAGDGIRGDMSAVVAAVLLDDEARDTAMMDDPEFGKIREPVIRFTSWARAFGVERTDTDGAQALRDTRSPTRLGQQAYRSPSVFNFYRPGFVAPGSESGEAGLVGPELQITTASSVTGYANFIEDFITRDSSEQNFVPDYSDEIALANDPAALVAHLNTLLAYGSLQDETIDRAVSAVQSITGGFRSFTRDEVRVQVAILFILTSSHDAIAR